MINPALNENIRLLENTFADCGDYVGRKFQAGGIHGIWLYAAYLDMLTDRNQIDLTVAARLFTLEPADLTAAVPPGGSIFDALRDSGLPTFDMKETDDMDMVLHDILAGDTVFFVDGYEKALVVSSKGFPSRGVTTAETEVVLQGSKEAFSEAFRINTALVRRRIRDTRLKIKQLQVGQRSQTDVALMYMDDIVRPSVLREVEKRVRQIDIDAIMDSGILEQLMEENWLSPFPQAQLTERPDKAAASILEGRIVIVVDNSPFVLIVPVTMNVFFQSAEDYYNRWQVASLTRMLRYAAACMAVLLPGFYIAVAVYHPSMLPLLMITKMAGARQNVPFPAVIEILLMDAAFELLREAGIRLPGAAGGTIGIVGGLIIGQAAVEAGLVSPIVVIIVALAGISSFAIPHVSLVAGFRLTKYAILLLAAVLGLPGFWAGLLLSLTHLASLRSFGFPYLFPYAAGEMNHFGDMKDSLIRKPLFTFARRPFFAHPRKSRRMRGPSR